MTKKNVTLLIDGKNVMYSSFKGSLDDEYLLKLNINGTYYFLYKLRKIISEFLFHPNYKINKVICFWDGESSGILKEALDPTYKANRHKKEKTYFESLEVEIFNYQIEITKKVLTALGINSIWDVETEADDLIATYCNSHDENIFILTTDLDIHQLISDKVKIYNAKKTKSKLASFKLIDEATYTKTYGYIPQNIPVYKALCGDISDNVRGIWGLKLKTLLKFFPNFASSQYTLDQVFEETKVLLNNNVKSKVLSAILEDKERVEKNFKIVNLKQPILSDFMKKNFIFVLDEKAIYNESDLNTLFEQYNLNKAFKKDHNIVSAKKFVLPFKKLHYE